MLLADQVGPRPLKQIVRPPPSIAATAVPG
jgi:hypothetical protein